MQPYAEHRHIPTSAGAVHVAIAGEGAPLLLLHANGHDHHDFDALVPFLSCRFRTHAVDFPGHGDSPPARVEASAGRFAAAIEEVVDGLGLDRVAFIGNSLGGFAAASFAIRRPRQCWGLVLAQPGGFQKPSLRLAVASRVLGRPAVYRRAARRFAQRYMGRRGPSEEAVIERAARHGESSLGATVSAALWRSFRLPEHDLRAQAAALVAPTLVVWGRRDPVRPLKEANDVIASVPHARLEVLDTGHVPFASDPAGFLALVEPFLATSAETSAR